MPTAGSPTFAKPNPPLQPQRVSERELELYRQIFAGSSDAIAIVDSEGRYLEQNPAHEKLIGYSDGELTGQTPAIHMGEAAFARVSDELQRNGKCRLELRSRRKDGEYVDIDLSAFSMRDESGAVICHVGIKRDITGRKRIEQERSDLLERERVARHEAELAHERVTTLIESMTDAFVSIDHNWRITYVNSAAEQVLGRSRLELFGRNLWEEFPAALSTRFFTEYQRAFAEQVTVDFDDFYAPLDKWLEVRAYPCADSLTIYFRDVTERKRNEILLAGQKRALEMMAEGAPLSRVLDVLAATVEQASPRCLASILLLDADAIHLRHGAAPSLPEEYTKSMDAVAIGPNVGSCGAAAFTRTTVVVSDLTTDPRWAEYRSAAMAHGLRACWSTPILSSSDEVLGTFALYYREALEPTAAELRAVEMMRRTAAIAMERGRQQDAVRTNQERLRLAHTVAGMATWEWNIHTNRIAWAESSAPLFGVPPEHLLRLQDCLALIHPDDRAQLSSYLDSCIRQGTEVDTEFRSVWPDHSIHWIACRGRVFYDHQGRPGRMIGISMDVTGRKLAQQALRESDDRFRQAQRSASIGAYDWNVDTGEITWSEELPALRGLVPEERFECWMDLLHPDDRGRVHAEFMQAVADLREFEIQGRFLLPDRGVMFFVSRGQAIRSESGATHIIGIMLDITHRKQAEELLQRSEKLATVGRLAASIAHEINNPLESITNLLYLLEHEPSISPAGQQYVRIAQDELARVSHISRQTLGFYRESATPQAIDVCELMRDIVRLYSRKVQQKQLVVQEHYSLSRKVQLFPSEIRQVCSNLLLNAIEATPAKGKIIIRVGRGRDWRHNRNGIRLTVADNGHGIRPDDRRHVFEPFFTTKGEKGTGLGLWVTSGIVQKHGGIIRVQSSTTPNRSGTVFSVFFPDHGNNVATLPLRKAEDAGEASGRKIAA